MHIIIWAYSSLFRFEASPVPHFELLQSHFNLTSMSTSKSLQSHFNLFEVKNEANKNEFE